MDEQSLASRLSDLESETEYLANTIYLDEDVPAERTQRQAHRLRETLGVTPRAIGASRTVERKRADGHFSGTPRRRRRSDICR